MPEAPPKTVECWACGQETHQVEHEFLPGPMFRCSRCNLLLRRPADADEVRDLYDQSYFDSYAGTGGYSDDELQRRYEARKRLKLVRRVQPRGRLLEVGAAEGYFLLEALRGGYEVLGVEPAAEAAGAGRRRSGAHVIEGFVEDVELPDASFDAACAWHVIEHIPEPLQALRRIRTALKPGGHLLLEVPNADGRQAARLGADWPGWDPPHHVAHYGLSAMRNLLERAGFEVMAMETFPGTGYFRPGVALRPGELACYVREMFQLRALPRRAHPWRHEQLRATARA